MGYDLVGENGPSGHLASTTGYGDLIDWAERYGGIYLKAFVKTGRSESPVELKDEIDTFLQQVEFISKPDIKNPDVVSTLRRLSKLLTNIKEIAIVPEV